MSNQACFWPFCTFRDHFYEKIFKKFNIILKESAILASSEAFSSVSDLLRIRRRPGDDRDPVKDLEMWMLCVVKDRDKTKSKSKTFENI